MPGCILHAPMRDFPLSVWCRDFTLKCRFFLGLRRRFYFISPLVDSLECKNYSMRLRAYADRCVCVQGCVAVSQDLWLEQSGVDSVTQALVRTQPRTQPLSAPRQTLHFLPGHASDQSKDLSRNTTTPCGRVWIRATAPQQSMCLYRPHVPVYCASHTVPPHSVLWLNGCDQCIDCHSHSAPPASK